MTKEILPQNKNTTGHKIARTAAQTAVLMAVLTLVSKLLGFVREMVMANFFGTSYVVDAYVMANAIPGILFGGLLTAVSTAYMPVFSQVKEKDGEKAGNVFTSEIINLVLLIAVAASIVGFVFSDVVVQVLAGGFAGETATLTSFFLKITFACIIFSGVAGIIDAYLQYKGKFLVQIVAGFSQNIMVIVFIVFSAFTNYYYIAFGLLIGMCMRCVIVFIYARSKKFRYYLSFKLTGLVKNIAVLALPVFIGSSIQQINTLVDKTLASSLPEGSVSALNYAMLLVTMIIGLTVTIFTTIIYPKLTQANSVADYERLNSIVSQGINLILIVTVPFSLGAVLYSHQVVQIVYERGAFDAAATGLTASAFAFYALGMIFLAANEFLTRTYYSMHNMRMPMIFAGISVIINIVLNLILVRFMAHNGLALATSISFALNTLMLLGGLNRKYPQIKLFRDKMKLIKIFGSAIAAVAASYVAYTYIILPAANIIYMRMVQLGLAVAVAGVVYLGLLILLKVDDIKVVRSLFSKN